MQGHELDRRLKAACLALGVWYERFGHGARPPGRLYWHIFTPPLPLNLDGVDLGDGYATKAELLEALETAVAALQG